MEIDIKNLEHEGYKHVFTLNHKELVPFVLNFVFRKNVFTLSFLILNCIFLLLLIWKFTTFILSTEGSFGESLKYFGYGCAITFVLIPPHELLHGLAYWICGAKNVSYKANWKQLYFMAVADKFITNRKSFYFIALLPFGVISLVMLAATFFASPSWQITWMTVALVHASMCAGDFGLLSFFASRNNEEMITWDDVENGRSFFYSKPR